MLERDWQKDWELCEKATGPWYAIPHPDYKNANWRVDTRPDVPWANFGQVAYMSAENAQFIAEARQALPYWLQRARELEEALMGLIGALGLQRPDEEIVADYGMLGFHALERAKKVLDALTTRCLFGRRENADGDPAQ